MRALLAPLLATLLLFSPVAAEAPHTLRDWATAVGLPQTVDVLWEEGAPDGFYIPEQDVCIFGVICSHVGDTIVVSAPRSWPRQWVLVILYHEIGHWEQSRERVPRDEWDADLRGIRMLCEQGFNGPELVAELFEYMTPYVVINAGTHGNHYQRIKHAREQRCNGAPHEVQA